MWPQTEEEACAKAHSTAADLDKSLEAAWESMNKEDLCKVYHSFGKHASRLTGELLKKLFKEGDISLFFLEKDFA